MLINMLTYIFYWLEDRISKIIINLAKFTRIENFWELGYFIYKPAPFPYQKIGILNSKRSRLFDTYTTDNEKISGLEIYSKKNSDDAKYIIYSHGNTGNIASTHKYLKSLSDTLDINVISYDYIGYGLSENKNPTEQRCYESLEYVIKYIIHNKCVHPSRIYLVGRSLGTGVVIDYISKNNWNTPVILISPYKSIMTINNYTRFLSYIDKFNSITKITNVKCPVKILHGENDTTIDISHSKELYEKLPNKTFEPTWLKNIGHKKILKHITSEYYLEVFNYKPCLGGSAT